MNEKTTIMRLFGIIYIYLLLLYCATIKLEQIK